MTRAHGPVTPGEILLTEFLVPLGISQYRLAQATGVSQTRISEIVRGKRSITTETALRLSKALGTDDRFWINVQADYDIEVARDRHARDLDGIAEIAVSVPPVTIEPMTTTQHPSLAGPTGRRVKAHRAHLRKVLERHGVTNAEIFGSTARGDDHEGSDLDLLVDLAPETDLFDLVRIRRELEEILGAPVDLIPRNGLKKRVRDAAERDLVPL